MRAYGFALWLTRLSLFVLASQPMGKDMKDRYRLFQNHARGGSYYIQNNETGKQESLRTRDGSTAKRIWQARNEAERVPAINLQIAKAYITASDPKMATRIWEEVMSVIVSQKHGETQRRWSVAVKDHAFDLIREKPLLLTTGDDLLKVMGTGSVSTNVYLRRLHNFALDMDWLLKSIVPKRQWPKVVHAKKRAITFEEHQRIIDAEAAAASRNQGSRNSDEPHYNERLLFYRLCWHLGGSQSDIAHLTADDIDWDDRTVGYNRKKLEGRAVKSPLIHFGDEVAEILRTLPSKGELFPYLSSVRAGDRATEFKQRCQGLGISGISLHSYRYAWAERARRCG
jgi:integrase